jgi:hypothetical protein
MSIPNVLQSHSQACPSSDSGSLSLTKKIQDVSLNFVRSTLESTDLSEELLPSVLNLQPIKTQSPSKKKPKDLKELFFLFPDLDLSKFKASDVSFFEGLVNSFKFDLSDLVLNDLVTLKAYRLLRELLEKLALTPSQQQAKIQEWIKIKCFLQLELSERHAAVKGRSMDKTTLAKVTRNLSDFSDFIHRFLEDLTNLSKGTAILKGDKGECRHKLALQISQQRIQELQKLYEFYLACCQPLFADKVLNDTPMACFPGYQSPGPLAQPQKTFLTDLIDYTAIYEIQISNLQELFKLPKDIPVQVAVFHRRLQNLQELKYFDEFQAGLKVLYLSLRETQKKHMKQVADFKRDQLAKKIGPDHPLLGPNFNLVKELICFCNGATKIMAAQLGCQDSLQQQALLANRAMLVSGALFENMQNLRDNFFQRIVLPGSSALDMQIFESCQRLRMSNFPSIMKKISEQTQILSYETMPVQFDLLFEELQKDIDPIVSDAMSFTQLLEGSEEIDFDTQVQVAGWLCSLLILKHDLNCVLQEVPGVDLEEILQPLYGLLLVDESKDVSDEELVLVDQIRSTEEVSESSEEVSESSEETANSEKPTELESIISVAANARSNGAEPTRELTAHTLSLEARQIEQRRKEQRKKHIEQVAARSAKARKFRQAVSKICGVDIAFLSRPAKGSHQKVRISAENRFIEVTIAPHNGGDREKLGTRHRVLKTAKAFADQVKKS